MIADMTPSQPSRQNAFHLSLTAGRTGEPAISDLMRRALANPDLISLAAGFVDVESLPVEATENAIKELLSDPTESRRALQYGTTQGDPRFRARLIERIEREENVAPGTFAEMASRTIVTGGSQQLLYLIAEALLDPGDIVIVEDPTYFVFLGLLASRGAEAIGVSTDEGGLDVDDLERTIERLDREGRLDRLKLIYTVSEHGNPTGLSLAAERRAKLVEIARKWSNKQDILILEDAAYRNLNFEGSEPPSVWSFDPDRVILARTFSKTFSPGLKTGYGILPTALVAPVLALKGSHDFGSSHFLQQVLERVLIDGGYDRQIVRLRELYREKRDVLLNALDRDFGAMETAGLVTWTRPKGGIYVWLSVPEGVDTGRDGPLFPRCVERGVIYVPGGLATADSSGTSRHIRLCYGVSKADELTEGIARLAASVADCLEPAASVA